MYLLRHPPPDHQPASLNGYNKRPGAVVADKLNILPGQDDLPVQELEDVNPVPLIS